MIGHDKHKPELPDTDAEDHCFVAGTLISTIRGEIPIENVVAGDEVLTRKGFKKVLAAGMTKRGAKVMTVTFSDGNTLTGTGNHPIFIKGKGFIPLDTIQYGDIIYPVSEVYEKCQESEPLNQRRLNLTGLRLGVIQTLNTCLTGNITKLTGDCIYTEKSGSSITAKYQKAITFTTKTGIPLIMTFLIWNCLRGASTCLNTFVKTFLTLTIMNTLKTTWMLSDQKPPSGTGRKKGESGTVNMGLNVQNANHKSQKLNAYAFNAGKNFTCATWMFPKANIVPPHVVQNTDAITGLTTKQESAPYAAKSLGLIDSVKIKLVAENAGISVSGLREENKKADVYNLTVDEEHEYFANGFLVHNCYDAIAYGCLSRPWVPIKKNEARRINDAWRKEAESRSAWTY